MNHSNRGLASPHQIARIAECYFLSPDSFAAPWQVFTLRQVVKALEQVDREDDAEQPWRRDLIMRTLRKWREKR